jgi:hypothetical protein
LLHLAVPSLEGHGSETQEHRIRQPVQLVSNRFLRCDYDLVQQKCGAGQIDKFALTASNVLPQFERATDNFAKQHPSSLAGLEALSFIDLQELSVRPIDVTWGFVIELHLHASVVFR